MGIYCIYSIGDLPEMSALEKRSDRHALAGCCGTGTAEHPRPCVEYRAIILATCHIGRQQMLQRRELPLQVLLGVAYAVPLAAQRECAGYAFVQGW